MTFKKNNTLYEIKEDHINIYETWNGGNVTFNFFNDLVFNWNLQEDQTFKELAIMDHSNNLLLQANSQDKDFDIFAEELKSTYDRWLDSRNK